MWTSKGRKQLTQCELPASSYPVYEIWAPVPPTHGSRIQMNGKWGNFKPFPEFSSVFSPLQVRPQTGQVQTTFPSHWVPVPQSLLSGVQRGCMLEGTSKGHPVDPFAFRQHNASLLKIASFVLEYSTIPVGHRFQGWTISSPKCFLLRSKREGRLF